MSSYMSIAQLEEIRKAQLKQELDESIRQLQEEMRVKHANDVHLTEGSHIKLSVFATDDPVEGCCNDSTITGAMLQGERKQSKIGREEFDLSELLYSAHKKPTKLEMELDSWIKRVEERLIVNEKDERDRIRLLAELSKLMHTQTIDIEDKIKFVKMRVSGYLQGATRISKSDEGKIRATYYEYCVLCEMFKVEPTETQPYQIEREVVRMRTVLEKHMQDEYVMAVIEDIMEELGCHAKGNAVLDHTEGQLYSVDGHSHCDVFMGNDGGGIMFEPVGEYRGDSLDKQHQIESSANSICSLYAKLEERAAEKGVILKCVYNEHVHIAEMYVRSDISESNTGKKQRKNATQKQRVLDSEGW